MCRQVHRGQLSVIFFTNSSANILRRPGLSDGYESPIYLTSGHLLHWQREEKKPIWRTTETTDAHTSHYATRSPPSPSPIFLDVREIYGLRWSWIKGTPGCVLSPSPINSRGRRSFPTAHSFYSIRSSVLQYPFDPLYPGSVPRRCASFLSRFCSPWCRWLLPSARGGTVTEIYTPDAVAALRRAESRIGRTEWCTRLAGTRTTQMGTRRTRQLESRRIIQLESRRTIQLGFRRTIQLESRRTIQLGSRRNRQAESTSLWTSTRARTLSTKREFESSLPLVPPLRS